VFSVDGIPVGNAAQVSGKPAAVNPLQYVFFGAPPLLAGAQASANLADPVLLNGQHTLVATYSGTSGNDPNYLDSTSTLLSFNLQPDFTMSPPQPSRITIGAPGGAATLKFSIGALDHFTGTVNFSCSGLPAESACNFSPATVKGSGTTTMTVTTTPAKLSTLRYERLLQFWASTGVGIAGVFLLALPSRPRRWRRILAFMAFALFLVTAGCGGGSSGSGAVVQHDPGTTAGTYNVTIDATSGSIVHKVPFQLVIR
jgi:hypothetical protein